MKLEFSFQVAANIGDFFVNITGSIFLAKNVTYLFQQADYETHIGVVLVAVISMKIRDSINSLNGV